MSDYSNKELLEAIYEVRDRVTRIEEKLNRAERMEDKVELAFTKAQEARDIGEDALTLAKINREEISSLKTSNRWSWGLLVTSLLTIGGFILDKFLIK
jgi:lipoate-protein ligase A